MIVLYMVTKQKLFVSTYQKLRITIMCIIKIDMIFYTVCIQNIYLYLTSSSHSSLMGILIVVNRTTELRRCMLTLCWTILYCNNAFKHVKITYTLFYLLHNKNNLSCLNEIFELCRYLILQDTNDAINVLQTSCTRNLFQKHEFKLWYFFQFFLNLGHIKERSEKHWHFCLFVIQ